MNMLKKFRTTWGTVRGYFIPLKSKANIPTLEISEREKYMNQTVVRGVFLGYTTDAEIARRNSEKLEIAKLIQDSDAVNKNLLAQHRSMIITFFATLIALFSSIAAIYISLHSKPPTVIVRPVVTTQQ